MEERKHAMEEHKPKTPSPKRGAHTEGGKMLPTIEKKTGLSGGGKNAKGGTDHVPRKERT